MSKDYYEILGLDRYCTQEDVKKSYKKLALQYHPDKNKDNEDAKEKFHLLSEAYTHLGDEKKRKNYDMFGADNENFSMPEDPFSMFNSIFEEHVQQFQNFEMNYENNFDIGGMIQKLTGGALGNLFQMPMPNVHVKVQSCKENIPIDDIDIEVKTTMKDIYNKSTKEITYQKDRIKKGKIYNKKVTCKVPLYHGEILCKGNGNETGDGKGNVKINIETEASEFKRVDDYDVFYEKIMSVTEYYSKKCQIELPHGEIVYLKDCKVNKIHQIKGKGIPYQEEKEWFNGDLFVYIGVDVPDLEELYDQLNNLLEEEEEEKKADVDVEEADKEYVEFKIVNWDQLFHD